MNENKNTTEDIIRNVEDESSDIIEQMQKDISEEIEIEVENEREEQLEDVNESMYEETVPEVNKKETKKQKTIRLSSQAKEIVKEADKKNSECRVLLMENIAAYEDAKLNLKENGFDTCNALLLKMDRKANNEENIEEAIVFEVKDQIEPLLVREVSSGKFSAFLSSLLVGGVTAVGLVYLATEKLGITLDITKIPSPEMTERILGWFSTLLGLEPNMYIGAGLLGGSAFLSMIVVYWLRVTLKANSNLHFAVKQFVEAELYAEQKSDCKVEMDKVDAHMKEAMKTLKTYEILFNEQQGKLHRILHIEGEKEEANEYHLNSFTEIRETRKLITAMKEFINTSMSDEGKLSEVSVERLEKLKTQMDHMIERLY